MQTFRDLLSKAEHLLGQTTGPPTVPRSSEIPVAGRTKLRTPKSLEAFGDIDSVAAHGFPLNGKEVLAEARLCLLADPHLTFEGKSPGNDEIISLGGNAKHVGQLGARRIVTATAASVDGQTLYGEAEMIYLTSGLGFGNPQVLSFRDRWTADLNELAVWITRDLQNSLSMVNVRPEPNAPHWTKAVLLLGGGMSDDLPETWLRELEFVAGLYCIALDVRPNPDSNRSIVLGELKRNPPQALLVWNRWVANSHLYLETYRSARPDGISDTVGEDRNTSLNFYEDMYEVTLHFETISPVTKVSAKTAKITSWQEAKPRILALECESFVLTERARSNLEANTYPDPERMFLHVERLAKLAADFADAKGNLGDRIVTVAESYEIEIALTDKSLAVSTITDTDGTEIDPTPHVKVDDYKSPDKCGRIYFGINRNKLRFVVDHIGLHDY